MALLSVPVSSDVRQTFDTVLAGQLVRFSVWWQPLDGHWYLSLAWQTDVRIISGVRMVTGVNLLSGLVSDFVGSLVVYGLNDQIGRDAWGVTHELIFDSEN